jgi:sugar lactone lactonase YvrE
MKLVIPVLMFISFTSYGQEPRIKFEAPKLYPEGIAYHEKKNIFYVSSVRTGEIGIVDESGKYETFYKDSTLRSSFGMKVDPQRNRLLVCIADPNYSKYSDSSTFRKMSRLMTIDLESGKRVSTIDLSKLYPGKHFANDLTLDNKGNIYITDSYSPVIYKVDKNDNPSILVEHELFRSKAVGLNGITFHPAGYLLVVNNGDGAILKVNLKTSEVSKVRINQFFPGADGLLIDKSNNLILIQNKGVNKVFKIRSPDNFVTAAVVETSGSERFQNPTTATFAGGKIFVLNSKMNELQDSTKNPSDEFSIQEARLKPREQ